MPDIQLTFLYAHEIQESVCHVLWLTAYSTENPLLTHCLSLLMSPTTHAYFNTETDIFIMQMSFHPAALRLKWAWCLSENSFIPDRVSVLFCLSHQHGLFVITRHSSTFLALVQSTSACICIMCYVMPILYFCLVSIIFNDRQMMRKMEDNLKLLPHWDISYMLHLLHNKAIYYTQSLVYYVGYTQLKIKTFGSCHMGLDTALKKKISSGNTPKTKFCQTCTPNSRKKQKC